MNINLILAGLSAIKLFLLSNIPAILFILGLVFIIYAVFLISTILGYAAIGLALMLIALILVKESQQGSH